MKKSYEEKKKAITFAAAFTAREIRGERGKSRSKKTSNIVL
jgi:hypothetical protein